MKRVEQTEFYDGTGKRGNCGAAAVASIFELTIEEVRLDAGCSDSEIMRWTTEHYPWLECRAVDLGTNYRVIEEATEDCEERWAYDVPDDSPIAPPTLGIWMATVESPRGVLKSGPYRGTTILHYVVMRGGSLAWDPHPERDMGVGRLMGRTWWVARDPARAAA